MKRLLSAIDLPKPVLIATSVIVVVLILIAAAVPLLGGARDDAQMLTTRLNSELQGANSAIRQNREDVAYVTENVARYEALMKGPLLVPHTRRAAVAHLQEIARQYGLSRLNYSFTAAASNSLAAVQNQSQAGGYTVGVESIQVDVAAAVDGQIYRFFDDILTAFPGSIVIEQFTLSRNPFITEGDLALIAAGQGGLVSGEARLSWRTAQAVQTEEKK